MINQKSIETIKREAFFSKQFLKPLYERYSIVKVVEIIKYLLAINKEISFPLDLIKEEKKPKKVILFLIDGLGWRFFEKFKNHPFLSWVRQRAIVSKITSQFPSTTAAHVTLFHAGLPVGQSGLYEWNYYEPNVDAVITPLLFSYAGDKSRDILIKKAQVNPKTILPKSTFYQFLKKMVLTHLFFSIENIRPRLILINFFKAPVFFPTKR